MAHHIAPPMPEFAEPAQTNLASQQKQQQQQPYPTVKRSENFSSDPNCMEKMYHFMDELGSGGFGKVKLAIHLLTGERVAIKIIDKKAIARDLPRVTSELAALKLLSHQNICRMFQFVETEEKYYIVMEYCNGGEMFDYIIRKERLGESEARHFFRQLVQAVAYIHSMGFAHRDLKPENLLLTQDLQLKVIDFGLCAKPLNGLDRPLDTCCGSPAYAAPELIQNHSYYGNEVDIWSMGVLLYGLLCGTLPFDDSNISRLYRRITSGLYVEPPFLTPPCREFLRTLLTVDPKRRATIRQILVHPWVNKNYEQQIKWHTIYSRDIVDEDVARELAYYHCTIPAEMVARIKQWRFDYLTATYLILLQKKERKQNYVLPSFRPNSNKMPCSPTIHASLDMDLDEVTAAGGSYDGEDSNSSDELMASTEKFKTLCCSPSVFAHHSPQQHHQRPKQHPPNCFSPTENGRHQPTPAAEMVQRMTIAMDCATATAADLRTQQQPNIGRYQPPNYQNQNQPIDRPKSVYTTPRRGPLPVPMFVSPALYRRPNSLERPTPFAADNEPMPMATTPLKQKIPQQQRSNSTDRPASSGDYDNENDHGNGGSGSLSSPPSIPGTPVSTGEGGERRRRMARIDQQQQQLLKTPRSNQRLRQRVFSSLERKADKMINLLTPRKLHKELPTKLKCIKTMVNVSVTSSSDPAQVRNELWKVLLAQGMETTQNGWKVSGSRKDTGVGLATTVELEVVAIEGLPYVGVKRKRIQGDAFTYKRICEEVLRLAGL